MRLVIFAVAVVLSLLIFGCAQAPQEQSGAQNAPADSNCTSYTSENCPSQCTVCPPCEVCSSISCQTVEFCESIGFNRSWWEEVRPKNPQGGPST